MRLPSALYEVLYVSTLAPEQPATVVGPIAAISRRANLETGITGLLIFDGQRFCQYLAGPQRAVLTLIERIRHDPRHHHVEILRHGPTSILRFREFSLAFSTLEDADALARMEGLGGAEALAAFEVLCESLELEN